MSEFTDPIKKHEEFILDTLLPMVFMHAKQVPCQPEESAMACFISLATVLQARGFTDSDLMAAINSASLSVTEAPEVLQ